MKFQRSLLLSRVRRIHPAYLVLGAFLGSALLAQLSQRRPQVAVDLPAGWSESLLEPAQRDLAQIHESGTLRVLLNSGATSYQVLGGLEYGFEFELARAFCEELGIGLEVVLADSSRAAAQLLASGDVDLVAMPHLATEPHSPMVLTSRPYDDVALVVVTPGDSLSGLADLSGWQLTVRENSREHRALQDLRAKGIDVREHLAPEYLHVEQLLEQVADGELMAAIAPANLARSVQSYREELHLALVVEAERPVRWLIRSNASELQSALDGFLTRQRRQQSDGGIARSALHNVLRRKYYTDSRLIRSRFEDPFDLVRTGRLSPYDELFQRESESNGVDWPLIASISFQESRFDPSAVSWAGAVGLLQMLPRTAGISRKELHDPDVNVALGVRHFRGLFDRYAYLPTEERLRFALAAYNCGEGHLEDARILALRRGWNPNDFEHGVAPALLLLARAEYHRDARYGYVRGTETVAYVREILRRYEVFQHILERTREAPQTAMLGPEVDDDKSDLAGLRVGLR